MDRVLTRAARQALYETRVHAPGSAEQLASLDVLAAVQKTAAAHSPTVLRRSWLSASRRTGVLAGAPAAAASEPLVLQYVLGMAERAVRRTRSWPGSCSWELEGLADAREAVGVVLLQAAVRVIARGSSALNPLASRLVLAAWLFAALAQASRQAAAETIATAQVAPWSA
jgi:hypothetical protein